MKTAFKTAAATMMFSIVMMEQAFARCWLGIFGDCGGGSPSGNAVPEIDGPAGIAAIALLVSVGAVLYNKARK